MRFNRAGLNEEYGLKSLKSFLQRVGFHLVSYEHTGLIFIRFYFVYNEAYHMISLFHCCAIAHIIKNGAGFPTPFYAVK